MNHWPARRSVLGLLPLFFLTPSSLGQLAPESAARLVPADVGIFVETRNAQDLLTTLMEPQLWTGLAAIAGQPANPTETRNWRDVIRRSVGMEPEEAIRVLFADGVAFVGGGIGRSQDAVVIACPGEKTPPDALLKKWEAKPISGDPAPSTYWLYRNLGVAVHGRDLIFGDLLPPNGMFRHVLDELRRPDSPRLADDPEFKKLLARIPPNPDGLCFLRFEPAPASQPSSQPTSQRAAQPHGRFPGPLGDSRHVMLAMHRDGALLHFTAIGDAVGTAEDDEQASGAVDLRTLPRDSLLVWESGVDFAHLAAQLDALPATHPLRLMLNLLPPDASVQQLAANFHNHAALVVGLVHPNGQGDTLPPLPAVGLVINLRDAATVSKCIDRMIVAGSVVYDSMSLARGSPALQGPRKVALDGVEASVIDLTDTVPGFGPTGLGELHLAWTIHDDALIVASHADWLRQIVAAREGAAPTLGEVADISPKPLSPSDDNAIVVRIGAIADVGKRWLDHLRATNSPILSEDWWRDRQNDRALRLGIDVAQDRDGKRLTVRSVQPNRPADGVLRPGDAIVGCNDRRFSTDEPIKEIRRALRERPDPAWIGLLIERDNVIREVRVPLPYLNPIHALERLIAVGQVARSVVYHDAAREDGLRGYLTIQLREPGGAGQSSRPSEEAPEHRETKPPTSNRGA